MWADLYRRNFYGITHLPPIKIYNPMLKRYFTSTCLIPAYSIIPWALLNKVYVSQDLVQNWPTTGIILIDYIKT